MPRRHSLSDHDITKLVMERFAPMRRGRPPESYSVLAAHHGLSEKTLQAAVIRAFQRGLITLDVAEIPPRYEINTSIAHRLRTRFGSLRMALVIETENDDDPDIVHCALGHALASKISSESSFFRPGDIIGVGTGRAVHYSAYYLSRLQAVDIDDIIIMSLTGSFFMLTHRDMKVSRAQHFVDADSNANLLSDYFTGSHKVYPISLPIAHPSQRRNDLIEKSLLNPLEFSQHTPSHAIVGLGVFQKSNGLVQEVRRHQHVESTMLSEMFESLNNIVDIIDNLKDRGDGYCPVGDICNLLFYIPPPDNMSDREKRQLRPLEEYIKTINSMLITPDHDQLNRINNLIVAAGTREKAVGLKHILTSNEIKVRGLCVDKTTANILLEQALD